MQKNHKNGIRLLAILAALLLLLLPAASLFVSAEEPPAPTAAALNLTVYEDYMSVDIAAKFKPALSTLAGSPTVNISVFDGEGNLVKPLIDVYDNLSYLYIRGLPTGDYTLVIKVFTDDISYVGTAAFKMQRYSIAAREGLNIDALMDALDNCYPWDLLPYLYTQGSWESYETAWFAARELYWGATDDYYPLPTQAVIDEAVQNLRAAFAGLEKFTSAVVDTSALAAALMEDCYLYDHYSGWYTYASWKNFSDAWYAAEELLYQVWSGSTGVDQAAIDSAAAALIAACGALEEYEYSELDISALEYALYVEYYYYYMEPTKYTAASWNNFRSAFFLAESMYDEIVYWGEYNYSQAEVDEMVKTLTDAAKGLELRTGFDRLQGIIDRIVAAVTDWFFELFNWGGESVSFFSWWFRQPLEALRYLIEHGI